MQITVNYNVDISDDEAIQDVLKELLDTQIDPENAGADYINRFRATMEKFGAIGLKNRLRRFRQQKANQARQIAAQAEATAMDEETTIGEAVAV